ncbi:winged helix-turn-helix transcriptional regulator [Leisingera methylohalidivorans]|nr:helix-turn-helix domain-containing protein [Leisingera methylohalidivorans]
MLYCPVNMACEVLQPRWTIHILAEMWWGTSRFNDFRRAIPRMSPSLLSKRLAELEHRGLIERVEDKATGKVEYLRTQAAVELEPIIDVLGKWAYRNADSSEEVCNAEPGAFVWNLRRSIDAEALPARRVVIKLHFPDQPKTEQNYWITARPRAPVDVCYIDPGYDIDLYITCELAILVSVYFGYSSLTREIENDRINLIGKASIARSIDRWLILSSFARDAPIGSDVK